MEQLRPAEIEIPFIEAGHHHLRCVLLQHPSDGGGGLAIVGELAADKGRIRAQPHRLTDRHPRAHPESSCPVAGTLDHSARFPAPPDHKQLHIPEGRLLSAADFDKEGIEIDVENSDRHSRTF